jgi:DNA-directed RNA polymerase subunit RPC12/RpoP
MGEGGVMRCTYCGSEEHTVANCPKTWAGSANRARLRCIYCGATDHDVRACTKTWSGNAARTWSPESVADHFIKSR